MVSKRLNQITEFLTKYIFLKVGFKLLSLFSRALETGFHLNLGYQLTQLSTFPKNSIYINSPHFLRINLEQPNIMGESTFLNPFADGVAIILQGAVGEKTKLLSTIISRYRNLYPLAHIILSTWESENTNFFQTTPNLHLVKSVRPKNPGISNVNLQLISTQAGIAYAEKLGCEYVIKSRSDQMLLNSTFLIKLHEVVENDLNKTENPRLVISSFNTFCFRKYSISDMFTFGQIKTMKDFWFAPLDVRESSENLFVGITNNDSWSKLRIAENYISSLYLEKMGMVLDFTFEQYYKALYDYFVVIDAQDLGQTWTKYTYFNPVYNLNNFPHSRSEVTSAIWGSLPALSQNLLNAAATFDYDISLSTAI